MSIVTTPEVSLITLDTCKYVVKLMRHLLLVIDSILGIPLDHTGKIRMLKKRLMGRYR